MAMCESPHCTSPLPPPGQTRNNSNRSMSLNSYITHPITAGPTDHQDHRDDPQGLEKNQLPCATFCGIACHSNCQKSEMVTAIIYLPPIQKKYRFYSMFPFPLPGTLLCHLMPPFSFSAHWHLFFPFLPLTRNT